MCLKHFFFKSNRLNTYLNYINSFISYSKSEAHFQLKMEPKLKAFQIE
jgi:hypothetical protein